MNSTKLASPRAPRNALGDQQKLRMPKGPAYLHTQIAGPRGGHGLASLGFPTARGYQGGINTYAGLINSEILRRAMQITAPQRLTINQQFKPHLPKMRCLPRPVFFVSKYSQGEFGQWPKRGGSPYSNPSINAKTNGPISATISKTPSALGCSPSA